jgi:hypothetical protein
MEHPQVQILGKIPNSSGRTGIYASLKFLVPQATYEFMNKQNWEWNSIALEAGHVGQPYL